MENNTNEYVNYVKGQIEQNEDRDYDLKIPFEAIDGYRDLLDVRHDGIRQIIGDAYKPETMVFTENGKYDYHDYIAYQSIQVAVPANLSLATNSKEIKHNGHIEIIKHDDSVFPKEYYTPGMEDAEGNRHVAGELDINVQFTDFLLDDQASIDQNLCINMEVNDDTLKTSTMANFVTVQPYIDKADTKYAKFSKYKTTPIDLHLRDYVTLDQAVKYWGIKNLEDYVDADGKYKITNGTLVPVTVDLSAAKVTFILNNPTTGDMVPMEFQINAFFSQITGMLEDAGYMVVKKSTK